MLLVLPELCTLNWLALLQKPCSLVQRGGLSVPL